MLTRTPVSAAVLAAILSISISSQALAVEVDGSDTNLNTQYPNGVIRESETGISASNAKVDFTLDDIQISAGETGVKTNTNGTVTLGRSDAQSVNVDVSANNQSHVYGINISSKTGAVTALAHKVTVSVNSEANNSFGVYSKGELHLGNEKTTEVLVENTSRGGKTYSLLATSDASTLIEADIIKLISINENSGEVRTVDNSGTVELKASKIDVSATGSKAVRGILSSGKFTLGNDSLSVINISAESSGDNAYGVQYSSDMVLNGDEIYISASGLKETRGIYSTAGKSVIGKETASVIDISSESTNAKAYGIYTKLNAESSLIGNNVIVSAEGLAETNGIYSEGKFVIGNESATSVSVSSESAEGVAYGIQGKFKSSILSLLSGSNGIISINATGNKSNGILINSGSANISGGSVEVVSRSEDGYAYGLYGVASSIDVEAASTNVVANAKGQAIGVLSQTGASITLGTENTGEVKLSAISESDAAFALRNDFTVTKDSTDAGISKTVVHGKSITLSAEGVNMARAVDSTVGGETVIGDTDSQISITATAEKEAVGIVSLKAEVEGKKTEDLIGGVAKVYGKDLTIDVTSGTEGNATGLLVQSSTLSATDNFSTLEVHADNTKIYAKTGMSAMSQGVLKVTGNLYVDSEQALTTRGNAVVRINESNDKTVQLKGDVVFDFDKPTSNTGVDADVLINLSGANSYWNGNTIIAWEGLPDADSKLVVDRMTLGLSEGATWTPTAVTDSAITDEKGQKYVALNQLNMQNGIVNMTDAEVNVTVESMTGSGIVNLATDLAAQTETGSFLVESAADGAKIDVNLMNKDMTAELTSDEVDAAKATELLANVGGQDVQTSTTVKEGMVQPGFEVDADGNSRLSGPNSLMQSTLELASATPLAINRILMNDVRKRLGDIRSDANTHGAWARYDGGRLSGSNGLENDFNTIQVGIDTKPEGTSTRLGVAFSYTNGDADYARGSADMDAYSLAAYGTWIGEQGGFVDVVGRFAKVDSDMTVDGNKDASVDNLALSLSAEAGWRFNITDTAYFEPQVEMTYTYVDSENVQIGNAQYKINSVDSLLGRLGFATGLNCPNNFGNVYVRASVVHEFLGDSKIVGATNGRTGTYEIDGKDTWFEYGLGANFNVSDSTYVWADVERTSGGALDEDWRATVGVRYSW